MTAEHARDPMIARLRAYWDARRGDRFAPARADIDPVDFGYALSDICLVDVVGTPPRFRYRIIGQGLIDRAGFNMTGRFLDESPEPEFRDRLTQTYGEAVDTRAPRQGIREGVLDGRMRRYEYLVLPLSSDGAHVDMLLIASRFAR